MSLRRVLAAIPHAQNSWNFSAYTKYFYGIVHSQAVNNFAVFVSGDSPTMKLNRFRLFVLVLSTALFTAITPAQSGYDHLNAPTADGSPTLKVTSDWLATTIVNYKASLFVDPRSTPYFNEFQSQGIESPYIDSACIYHFTTNSNDYSYHYLVPLGAISSVSALSIPVSEREPDMNYRPNLLLDTGSKTIAAIQAIKTLRNISRKHNNRNSEQTVTNPIIYLSSIGIILNEVPLPSQGEAISPSLDQMNERTAKAFQHAVSLCAGTYQAPAQTTQPF